MALYNESLLYILHIALRYIHTGSYEVIGIYQLSGGPVVSIANSLTRFECIHRPTLLLASQLDASFVLDVMSHSGDPNQDAI